MRRALCRDHSLYAVEMKDFSLSGSRVTLLYFLAEPFLDPLSVNQYLVSLSHLNVDMLCFLHFPRL